MAPTGPKKLGTFKTDSQESAERRGGWLWLSEVDDEDRACHVEFINASRSHDFVSRMWAVNLRGYWSGKM